MKLLGATNRSKYVNCLYVVNKNTKSVYETNKAGMSKEHQKERILWRGSMNRNWLSILMSGPDMAHTKDGMFGVGIYFANKAGKSAGYTDSRQAAYTKTVPGKHSFFLGLFRVLVGKEYKISDNDKRMHFFT